MSKLETLMRKHARVTRERFYEDLTHDRYAARPSRL
jgi:hypothetical protein